MGLRLKEQLRNGQLTRVFCLGQLCNPKWIEIIAWQGGYDAVWLDQEHSGLTIEQIEQACRAACGCDMETFVRLAAADYATVMRPLEAGANGIMAAQVRNASQAEEIVRWAKFHPRGQRGINTTGVDGRYGAFAFADYLQHANENTFVALQIENAEAVADVDKIARVPDVDLLFVGPADLSQSMGLPGQWDHPRLWTALDRVAAAAGQAGIHWGILPLHPDHAQRCVEMGCRMLSIGIDVWAIQRGLKSFKSEYQVLFGSER